MTINEKDYCYECANPWHLCICNPEKKLPERINVTRLVTYDVPKIVEELNETGYEGEITTEMLLDYIEDKGWLTEDFGTTDLKQLIIQDENGNEL